MLDRRRFLAVCSQLGLTSTLFPGVLWGMAEPQGKVTKEMIGNAADVADLAIPDDLRDAMLESLDQNRKNYEEIYKLKIANSVAPAFVFDPVLPGMKFETVKRPLRMSGAPALNISGAPKNIEDVAFYSVRQLAELVRTRKVSSAALTDMYLARLKKYDPMLKFVITLTEDRAHAKAQEADREIAAGKYRGPLHGLPWGAKDLLAVKGYRTTWGAGGFEQQSIDEDATVVKRLDQAGAVLVAKLTLGALAQGDKWFGGMTRNPWNPHQGSSGSSAGSSSATAAGCVAFAIGSETLGSISSPSTRCGATGLRPTFGLVPRTGAMALSWTMDKLGPICRAVEDTALVLHAIYGPDGGDRTVRDVAFNWDANLDWRRLRVGYFKDEFEFKPPAEPPAETGPVTPEDQKKREERARARERTQAMRKYDQQFNDAAIAKLQGMGVKLIPVEVPKIPYGPMRSLLLAEAAAAFDDLTRSGRDKLLTEQSPNDWPNAFRIARLTPAVEYIQANRARMQAMEMWKKLFEDLDVIVAPTFSQQLVATNLTGNPAVIVPNGFRGPDAPKPPRKDNGIDDGDGGPGTPVSLTFLGPLYGEAKVLAFAKAYQDATNFHLKHPDLDTAMAELKL